MESYSETQEQTTNTFGNMNETQNPPTKWDTYFPYKEVRNKRLHVV